MRLWFCVVVDFVFVVVIVNSRIGLLLLLLLQREHIVFVPQRPIWQNKTKTVYNMAFAAFDWCCNVVTI
jgi:hypothetical protein